MIPKRRRLSKIHTKTIKKILPCVLSGTILLNCLLPAEAAENAAPKEEVIYINLQSGGAVKDIYAVNIFGKGSVTDYGNYSSVKLLNTNDPISQEGDKVTLSASADRTYYEGRLENTNIPWNISLTYSLDGREYQPSELAGKSGHIEIHFKVTENTACKGSFYEDYALQASFTLDTDKCTDIIAGDATIANVGNKKQLSYTMLPGKGIDTVITADVTDFEMAAVSINGIPLSLNVDVDDDELMDQINDLLDAIAELDDGAGDLKDGISELQDGAENDLQSGVNELADGASKLQDGASSLQDGGAQLNNGTNELQNGAASLYSGVESLHDGISSVQKGLNELNSKSSSLTEGSAGIKSALSAIQENLNQISFTTDDLSALVNGASDFQSGLDSLCTNMDVLQSDVSYDSYKDILLNNNLNLDDLQTKNTDTINELDDQIKVLEDAGEDASQLKSLRDLISANSGAISGMDSAADNYLTGISSNISNLNQGLADLKTSYADINAGIQQLDTTMSSMASQMAGLKTTIDTLVSKYTELDSGLNEYTSGVSKLASGYSQIVSGSGEVLNGTRNLKDGASELYSKTGEMLTGITEFYDATGSLRDGTGELNDGVVTLLSGIAELYDGSGELKDGTGELRSETDDMDTEISDKIDDMLASITGDDTEIVSFVSAKNTNVQSVQFVIQTEAIEIPETDTAEAADTAPLTFWQKLLALFKIN